jgi:hypothetical protein
MEARGPDELIERREPAWPKILGWIAEARWTVEVLPVERERGEQALLALQVTSRSALGALALECGGILVDHGWLRLLGAGSARMVGSLLSWNGLEGAGVDPPIQQAMLVAHDAAGGFFAINGDASSGRAGTVVYFAPDTLEWDDLDMGHSALVHWAMTGDLDEFYAELRWPGWQDDVAGLAPDRGFSVYPPLWAQGPPIGERTRGEAPMTELWGFHNELASQLSGATD